MDFKLSIIIKYKVKYFLVFVEERWTRWSKLSDQ